MAKKKAKRKPARKKSSSSGGSKKQGYFQEQKMTAKNILGIVPGLQATALVAYNIPKFPKMKPAKKMAMKKPAKTIIKKGVVTLMGVALIKPTAQMINKLQEVKQMKKVKDVKKVKLGETKFGQTLGKTKFSVDSKLKDNPSFEKPKKW